MKMLTLLLILAATIIFVVQNLEPISLVFLNAQIAVQLPVAVWILLAVFAGMLTSLLIQLLNRSNGRVQQPIPPSASDFGEFKESRSPRYDPVDERSYVRPEPTPSSTSTTTTEKSDWEKTGDREWNIEEPPQENFERQNLQDNSDNYDVREQPLSSSRSSSVYSYSYREAKNKNKDIPAAQTDRIYDANYRVINPPYRQEENRKVEDEENEDDWI